MVTIGQEIADLLPPDAAAALRRSTELNGITLKYAGWTERGFTAAMLISTFASEVGMSDRKLVLKYSPGGRGETAEPRRHREALAASSSDFRRDHLVELPWAAIAVPSGGWIMFQEIASGSLDDIRPLSILLRDPLQTDAATACATIVRSLLDDWNPVVETMDPFPAAGGYLRDLLRRRLAPGGTLRTWAEAKGVLLSGQPTDGPPNPFALVLDNSLTKGRTLYMRLGNVHGDLHPGNILVPRDPMGYRLVDLSRFGTRRPLAFDLAYLLVTIAAQYLPDLSEPERNTLAEFLVDPATGRRASGPAAVQHVLRAIIDAAGEWGARNGLGDEWRHEVLLNVLGCALIMTGRAFIPNADRDWYYDLARRATARYLELPGPTEPRTTIVHNPPAQTEVLADIAARSEISVETTKLPAGTWLWRVHQRLVPAAMFTADPTGRRSIMYASRRQVTALLDEVLRGVPFANDGVRILTPQRMHSLRLSPLRTTRDLLLACADSEPDLVGLWPPDGVHGIEWPSTGDLPELTLMLLADRCPVGTVRAATEEDAIDLDDPGRWAWLRDSLRPYRVRIADP